MKPMTGRRARLGFLVMPGNPREEPEITALASAGVSLHPPGALTPGAARAIARAALRQ
jgi:hypothetical protein